MRDLSEIGELGQMEVRVERLGGTPPFFVLLLPRPTKLAIGSLLGPVAEFCRGGGNENVHLRHLRATYLPTHP